MNATYAPHPTRIRTVPGTEQRAAIVVLALLVATMAAACAGPAAQTAPIPALAAPMQTGSGTDPADRAQCAPPAVRDRPARCAPASARRAPVTR